MVGMPTRRAFAALAVGAMVAALASAGSAGAAVKTFTGVSCVADLGGGNTIPVTQDFTLEVTSPASVSPGDTFTITIPSRTTDLPATANGIPVDSYSHLANPYVVTGGTVVAGSLSVSGSVKNNGATKSGDATISGNTVTLTVPGPLDPGTLVSPTVTFKVKAGAGGTTVAVHSGTIKLTATAAAGTITAAVSCDVPTTAITSTSVVTPGAPTAVDDAVSTAAGQAVTIDVLANDKPNGFGQPPNPDTLEVTSGPGHGTAVVSSGTIVYTPAAGFTGTDTFTYSVCDIVENPTTTTTAPTTTTTVAPTTTTVIATAAFRTAVTVPAGSSLRCDPATVTVTIGSVGTEGTTAATVAPAAELPRTGSSSAPFAALGLGLCVAGGATSALGRRRRATN